MNQQNPTSNTYTPSTDGVDHIWLSPHGKTVLGRKLFIGAHRPFRHPQYGTFASVMAFWLWYDSGQRVDGLREIHHDNMLRSSMFGLKDMPGNRQAVVEALRHSIYSDPVLIAEMKTSHLPFAAYEVIKYPQREDEVIYPLPDREWYVLALEELRQKK